MATTPQAFDDFMKRLELTDAEQEQASRQQNDLRERLRRELGGITRDFLVGSYARRTAIRPLNDIDLFLVLDPQVHGARHAREPLLLLEDVQRALRNCYPPPPNYASRPSPETRIQGRSVNIQFSGTGIGYDVIPAFLIKPGRKPDHSDGIYEIPDRAQQIWIQTNPEVHRLRCSDANERAGGMLNRLIKAAKHWNQGQRDANGNKPLRSFHLETMAYGAFQTKPADERRGLRDLFHFLSTNVVHACPDPAGLGPDVAADLRNDSARLGRARRLLREAASLADEAVRHERLGEHTHACAAWRQLLGADLRT